jgi:predicted nucleic acid-binding protein
MMSVFFDINVLLDVLAKRELFHEDSAGIWTLAEQDKIHGLASALSFSNIYYIVRRLKDRRTAERAMRVLRNTFDAGMKDSEDAIQYFSALRAESACLVSRNPDHFPRSPLPIVTPAEFLAAHSFQ